MKRPTKRCGCGGVLRSKEERASGICWMCQLQAAQRAQHAGPNGKERQS